MAAARCTSTESRLLVDADVGLVRQVRRWSWPSRTSTYPSLVFWMRVTLRRKPLGAAVRGALEMMSLTTRAAQVARQPVEDQRAGAGVEADQLSTEVPSSCLTIGLEVAVARSVLAGRLGERRWDLAPAWRTALGAWCPCSARRQDGVAHGGARGVQAATS
ncbi:MAG: hypothetical protein IPP44_00155 [Ideonella sp.]|nr:hypothetical protein [Ideonella sp.]